MIPILFSFRLFGDDDSRKQKYHAIHRAYRNLMFHAAHHILQNEQDAEALPPDPHTRSVALLITEHKAIDLLRRKQKLTTLPLDEQYTPGAAYEEGFDLDHAIYTLPEDLRTVLLLRYKMGYSTREIGEKLGKSHHTVAKLLTRAKKELAQRLKEED